MDTQVDAAARMYDARAAVYEDSWHPDYSKRFIAHLDIRPGMRILDLCCGTGLEAFLAAELVGDGGEIIGVDISNLMMAELKSRQKREPRLGARITVLRHDVTSLDTLPELAKSSFDIMICSNAFVLFGDPAAVVKGWREYLKDDGVMAVDIPHEFNLRSGLVIERVAKRMGIYWPSNRSWVTSRDSFKEVLEGAGFDVGKVEELVKVTGQRSTHYTLDQADEQFDYIASFPLSKSMMETEELKERGREIFREEFAKDAVDGKVEIVDSLYLYIARRSK